MVQSMAFSGPHIDDTVLWKNVVNLDRLAWVEQEGLKKVNDQINDQEFVRRIYIDITGKIPTYGELLEFLKSKNVNKRSELIAELLDSPGYVSNFTNFWNDLLRNPYKSITSEDDYYKEFTRYIERFLAENKTYDKIVYDMLTSEGTIQQNQGVGFYLIDYTTDTHDTLNATVRAFLGTRIGCAQCHNHRFDKWTQKEFYESSAFLYGAKYRINYNNPLKAVMATHYDSFVKGDQVKGKLSSYSRMLFMPSRAEITYSPEKQLKYPESYAYANAKPNEFVAEKIVFDYGDKEIKGKGRRETFATWLTSKNNPMFARIMANRIWKRIMGVGLMEPVDDWKDNIVIQNPNLFNALGDIFASLNYDFKAFMSVIFNSEAYQLGYQAKNVFTKDEYKLQGAMLKRMSYAQLIDSLLTLQYGNSDDFFKLDPQYFEFEDKLNALTQSYKDEVIPLIASHNAKYGEQTKEIDAMVISTMNKYFDKLQELEAYYQMGLDGRLKGHSSRQVVVAEAKINKNEKTMMAEGSMKHMENNNVMRAHYQDNDFMKVFGATSRTAPDTEVNMGATMKQILKMMNSDECKNVVKEDSYLMQELFKLDKMADKISFLYYSIFGRAPNGKDLDIAVKFFSKSEKPERWSKYTLALINSPEFYFYR